MATPANKYKRTKIPQNFIGCLYGVNHETHVYEAWSMKHVSVWCGMCAPWAVSTQCFSDKIQLNAILVHFRLPSSWLGSHCCGWPLGFPCHSALKVLGCSFLIRACLRDTSLPKKCWFNERPSEATCLWLLVLIGSPEDTEHLKLW